MSKIWSKDSRWMVNENTDQRSETDVENRGSKDSRWTVKLWSKGLRWMKKTCSIAYKCMKGKHTSSLAVSPRLYVHAQKGGGGRCRQAGDVYIPF
jgi:hypothetical protein